MKTLPDFLFYLALIACAAVGIYSQFYFLAIIPIGILISILGFKLYSLYWNTERILRESKKQNEDSALIKKYRRAKIGRGIPFKAAMLISVASIFSAFSYVSHDVPDRDEKPSTIVDDTEPIEIIPELVFEKPKPIVLPKLVKKTPPPKILDKVEIVPDDNPEPPEIIELATLEPDDKVMEDLLSSRPVTTAVLPATRPPTKPSNELVESFLVDRMPCLAECDMKGASNEEVDICTLRALRNFFGERTKYPRLARENGFQGKVWVSFIVDTDGSVTDIEVLRDPGGGLGDEVKEVVGELPSWSPGRQGKRAVRVKYTTSFTFKLE